MTRDRRPSGRLAGDVVAYLVAGVDDDAEDGAPGPRHVVGHRELGRIRGALSELDFAVLQAMGDLHYLTTRQVQRLHFDVVAGRPYESSRRSAGRALTRLQRLGVLDRLPRRVGGSWGGSAPHIWRLTPAGRRLVADESSPTSEPGLAHLAHELAVTELVVRVHEAARKRQVEVVAVEAGPVCWQPFTTSCRAPAVLKPDLRLTLVAGAAELHWFVEVDRASEHRPTLRHKVDAYRGAWRDGRGRSAGVFPRVLWVVPHDRRASMIRDVCAESGAPARMFEVAVSADAVDVLLRPR